MVKVRTVSLVKWSEGKGPSSQFSLEDMSKIFRLKTETKPAAQTFTLCLFVNHGNLMIVNNLLIKYYLYVTYVDKGQSLLIHLYYYILPG